MSDLTDEQLGSLERASSQGGMIRDLCQHPGFKIYLKSIEELKNKKEKQWLLGTEDEARLARAQAQGLDLAITELKKFIISGDRASKMLNEAIDLNRTPVQ